MARDHDRCWCPAVRKRSSPATLSTKIIPRRRGRREDASKMERTTTKVRRIFLGLANDEALMLRLIHRPTVACQSRKCNMPVVPSERTAQTTHGTQPGAGGGRLASGFQHSSFSVDAYHMRMPRARQRSSIQSELHEFFTPKTTATAASSPKRQNAGRKPCAGLVSLWLLFHLVRVTLALAGQHEFRKSRPRNGPG